MLDETKSDDEIIATVTADAESGALIIQKHDPDELPSTSLNRSVVSHETKRLIADALKAENEFEWHLYRNNDPRHNDFYLILVPTSECRINIAASGVVCHTPVNTMDNLLVVDSPIKSRHLYGADSSNVANRMRDGTLDYVRRLHRTKKGRGK